MKKITSMFMAVAMILALAVPALAGSTASGTITGTTTSGNTVEPENPYKSTFKGEYQDTVIDIELPNDVALVFNPYRLQYNASTLHGSETTTAFLVDKLADQIFSAPVTIVSKSNISLKVDMTIEASKDSNSDIEFAEAVTDFDDETKYVFLQMEYGLVTSANADPSTSTDKKTITLAEEELTLTGLQETEDQKANDDATKQNLWVAIPAGSAENPQYFSYKFTGEAEDEPGTSDDPNPYRSDDKINVAMTFTFIPVANDDNQLQAAAEFDATAANQQDIDALLPAKITLRSSTSLTEVTPTYDVSGTATAGVALSTDGTKITINKQVIAAKIDATKTAKYVVIIPVKFTADIGSTAAQLKTYEYNVRVIIKPAA